MWDLDTGNSSAKTKLETIFGLEYPDYCAGWTRANGKNSCNTLLGILSRMKLEPKELEISLL